MGREFWSYRWLGKRKARMVFSFCFGEFVPRNFLLLASLPQNPPKHERQLRSFRSDLLRSEPRICAEDVRSQSISSQCWANIKPNIIMDESALFRKAERSLSNSQDNFQNELISDSSPQKKRFYDGKPNGASSFTDSWPQPRLWIIFIHFLTQKAGRPVDKDRFSFR